MYDRTVVPGSSILHVNVRLDHKTVHQQVFQEYRAYPVFVVHHGSNQLAVNTISVASLAVKLRLNAVGATLFRVYIADHVDSFHRLSLTFARIV